MSCLRVPLTDTNGKKLRAGKDYDSSVIYKCGGKVLDRKKDKLPSGAVPFLLFPFIDFKTHNFGAAVLAPAAKCYLCGALLAERLGRDHLREAASGQRRIPTYD